MRSERIIEPSRPGGSVGPNRILADFTEPDQTASDLGPLFIFNYLLWLGSLRSGLVRSGQI